MKEKELKKELKEFKDWIGDGKTFKEVANYPGQVLAPRVDDVDLLRIVEYIVDHFHFLYQKSGKEGQRNTGMALIEGYNWTSGWLYPGAADYTIGEIWDWVDKKTKT